MIRRIAEWLLLVFGVLVLSLSGFAGLKLYRVYYGRHVYETTPPELPAQLTDPAILIFSKTNGFRQDDAVKAANAATLTPTCTMSWVTWRP
jgi:hypothetical protein